MKENEIRACWWCVHFDFDSGDPGYSEMTPGWLGHMRCKKKHWKFECDSQDHFGKCLSTAQTCEDFKKIGEK